MNQARDKEQFERFGMCSEFNRKAKALLMRIKYP